MFYNYINIYFRSLLLVIMNLYLIMTVWKNNKAAYFDVDLMDTWIIGYVN